MKILRIILGAMMLIGLGACEKYEIDTESQEGFKGDFIIYDSNENPVVNVENKGTMVLLSKSISVEGKYDIYVKKVKFDKNMPVSVDLTIPSVDMVDNIISGENITPYTGLGPYKKRIFSQIEGELTVDENGNYLSLSLDMICGDQPVTYRGVYIEE